MMILAITQEQRKAALDLLLPYQRSDFEGIFRAMDGLPVTIRLLDPPLHEFLPEGDLNEIVGELTSQTGMKEEEIVSRIEKLFEVNPMLGFRGCRLGISYPELTEMQARAVFQAAISVSSHGITVLPEIMVPLIGTPQELRHQVSLIRNVAEKVFSEMGSSLSYKVGTMIEVPRAALVADEIANEADFFSFGTNDLTQMTFGYSRDDVSKFLPTYLSAGILQHDPFERVFTFGKGRSDGNKAMKSLLGGKGANLAEMATIGLSVPPGLTISTEACREYQQNVKNLPNGLWEEILEGLNFVQNEMGAFLGNPSKPLLVSVRSGAAISMPGMMDTVLNLGLNDEVVAGLASKSGERFAYDSYRRFLDMFGNVVMDIPHSLFEDKLEKLKQSKGIKHDTGLSANDLKNLVEQYKNVYVEAKGEKFPSDPKKQLELAVKAVFNSWDSPRAIKYRNINQITGLMGTAVNIQSMVFGNMGNTSGTGVLFTRNPSTGEKKLYGEFLTNAQGEDVVAGIRTPEVLETMKTCMPDAYKELEENCKILENHYKDMMDIEFTVQENRLWMLQCRIGKRTGKGAIKIATDMVNEGLVDIRSAIKMVEPQHLNQFLHPQFEDPSKYKNKVVATGLPASPGAAVGQVVFTAEDAEEWHAQGKSAILVRTETSPEDIGGMHSAVGILTARGGMTSHAAVVARGWGKCCVSGCSNIEVNESRKVVVIGDMVISEGEWISLNGSTGEVILGKQALSPPALSEDLETFMSWADQIRKLKVLANADTPEDAITARRNGAQGIGLCRTEHMFFASDERLKAVRRMIMAITQEQRKAALEMLLPYQQSDFEGIFHAMDGLPVTIRLLDPPLHEFLPEGDLAHVVSELTSQTGMKEAEIFSRIEKLSEVNPMLGFRGCRLGISYPELTEMQARAIFQAAVSVSRNGIVVLPEIMVPLVGTPQELRHQVSLIRNVAEKVFCEMGSSLSYKVGTMIEVPRAALVADEIANEADFFSFGTNDLTQMTFGYSRDDVGKFLPSYLSAGILQHDPFEVLDQKGVGQLIKMCTEKGRTAKPNLKVGICGEHGGEPSSIAFFAQLGLDYVSCSPFRIPIARLAAAQVAV